MGEPLGSARIVPREVAIAPTMGRNRSGSQPMQAYLWVKSFHLLFVMAWVAAAFYLPRILINLVEAGADATVRARLVLRGRRLYRSGT